MMMAMCRGRRAEVDLVEQIPLGRSRIGQDVLLDHRFSLGHIGRSAVPGSAAAVGDADERQAAGGGLGREEPPVARLEQFRGSGLPGPSRAPRRRARRRSSGPCPRRKPSPRKRARISSPALLDARRHEVARRRIRPSGRRTPKTPKVALARQVRSPPRACARRRPSSRDRSHEERVARADDRARGSSGRGTPSRRRRAGRERSSGARRNREQPHVPGRKVLAPSRTRSGRGLAPGRSARPAPPRARRCRSGPTRRRAPGCPAIRASASSRTACTVRSPRSPGSASRGRSVPDVRDRGAVAVDRDHALLSAGLARAPHDRRRLERRRAGTPAPRTAAARQPRDRVEQRVGERHGARKIEERRVFARAAKGSTHSRYQGWRVGEKSSSAARLTKTAVSAPARDAPAVDQDETDRQSEAEQGPREEGRIEVREDTLRPGGMPEALLPRQKRLLRPFAADREPRLAATAPV